MKKSVLVFLWVDAIPTKEPLVPIPTLTVAIPITSFEILATNKVWSSTRVDAEPTLFKTSIPLPFPGEYVNWSPVLSPCSLM